MNNLLLVVDCQKDFLLPTGKLYLGHDTSELRAKIGKLVKEFTGSIYVTKDTHFKDSIEFEKFPEHCLKDTEGWELIDEIDQTYIDFEMLKCTYSENSISHNILEENKDIIYIVGVCTHICVHDIVIGIVNESKHHFNKVPKIVILKEYIDDFDPEMAAFALKRLVNLYGVEVA